MSERKDKNLKKKKKKKNGDVIVVLFVFAVIILSGIVMSILNVGGKNNKISKTGSEIAKEEQKRSNAIIITVGTASVLVVGAFVYVKVKAKRKKRKLLEEKLKRKKEIEAARERLAAGPYADILAAGKNVLSERKEVEHILESQNAGIRHKYDLNNIDDDYDDEDDIPANSSNNRSMTRYEARSGMGYTDNKSLGNRKYIDIDEDIEELEQDLKSNRMIQTISIAAIGVIIILVIVAVML